MPIIVRSRHFLHRLHGRVYGGFDARGRKGRGARRERLGLFQRQGSISREIGLCQTNVNEFLRRKFATASSDVQARERKQGQTQLTGESKEF